MVDVVDARELTDRDRQERYGHHNRWRVEDGRTVMPEKQEKFLVEWCMVYPRPCSQAAWAEANGVHVRTLGNWLADPRFREEWRSRADDSYASPEFTQPLVVETYRIALNEDGSATKAEQLKAIEVFSKFVNMTTPTEIRHTVVPLDKQLEALSVEELAVIAAGTDVIDVDGKDVIDVEGKDVTYDV